MPHSTLLSLVPPLAVHSLAGLTADQIRVVADAYPAPGFREFRLVAPNGIAIVKAELLAALTTPEIVARFAELRFRLPLELLAAAGGDVGNASSATAPPEERHLRVL